MAANRQPRKSMSAEDQERRDRELDAWMDRALGARKPSPMPDIHDV